MSKTIIVAGYGPGISKAVAERFGREGYRVALVARSADKLAAAATELTASGIEAKAFPADLGDTTAVTSVVEKIRTELGPVAVLHWNAYSNGAGDLEKVDANELASTINLAIVSLNVAIQAALPDLRAQKGAILVTNGGLGFIDPQVDAMGAKYVGGLSIANAAKRKLVAILAIKYAPDVFTGEVVVTGGVKGSAFDDGTAKIEAKNVAEKFWALAQERKTVSVNI